MRKELRNNFKKTSVLNKNKINKVKNKKNEANSLVKNILPIIKY
jgi:hypothetical protein